MGGRNMDYKEMYQQWLDNPYFDEETKAELKAIAGNEKEIEDRFYMDLEFGTQSEKRHRAWQTIFCLSGQRQKALRLHTIPDICRRSLRT